MSDKGDPPKHLTDGRPLWDWKTRYPKRAWICISIELAYLTTGLVVGVLLLHQISAASHNSAVSLPHNITLNGVPKTVLIWLSVAIGGACGGCSFALKWLYHGVAYGKWHQDRMVWRFVVPVLSGILALFTGLMISAGIIPIFNTEMVASTRSGAAFGFFVGFFSDNVLAALQRIADQTLGTLGRVEETQKKSVGDVDG